MKTLLLLSILLSIPSYLDAGVDPTSPYRTWTQKETGRTIEAKAVDKKGDGSSIQVFTKRNKRVWLKTSTLSEEDQTYIEEWSKPVDHLSIRVAGSGKGYKLIEITAKAGGYPVRVVTSNQFSDQTPHVQDLDENESLTYKVKLGHKYTVTVYQGHPSLDEETTNIKILDEETNNNKTKK